MDQTVVDVVDEQPVAADGISAALEGTADLRFGHAFGTAEAAVHTWQGRPPAVAIVDGALLGGDPMSALRVLAVSGGCRALVRATTLTVDAVQVLFSGGAAGVVSRSASADEVVRATRTVSWHGRFTPAAVKDRLHERLLRRQQPGYLTLTARERQAVVLAGCGMPAACIAERLVVEPTTVRTHLRRAYAKLGVRGHADALVELIRLGIVDPGRPDLALRIVAT